jgi:aminoglycoside 6'-N-acetyltransferase I
MSNLYSSVVVRSIAPSDAAVWEAMRRELWPDESEDHGPEIAMYFAGTLQEPTAVLVAERFAGWIVGFVELSIRLDIACFEGKRVGYVEGLYVIPVVRHRGVAWELLQASRAWARQQKCDGFASDRAGRVVVDRSFEPCD